MAKATTEKKPPTKSQLMGEIAEKTDLTKKDVEAVFVELESQIKKNLGRSGPGTFNLPGLMKIVVQEKPATKQRKGRNPFTGEEITIKAKPKRKVVKVRPLKGLKDMIKR